MENKAYYLKLARKARRTRQWGAYSLWLLKAWGLRRRSSQQNQDFGFGEDPAFAGNLARFRSKDLRRGLKSSSLALRDKNHFA
jgi:hypothetical protein